VGAGARGREIDGVAVLGGAAAEHESARGGELGSAAALRSGAEPSRRPSPLPASSRRSEKAAAPSLVGMKAGTGNSRTDRRRIPF